MLKPIQELPNIPASRIMDLRTADGLDAASYASTESNSYALIGDWLAAMADEARAKKYLLANQHSGFEVGVKLGQALGYELVQREEDGYTFDETHKALSELEAELDKPQKFKKWLLDNLVVFDGERASQEYTGPQLVKDTDIARRVPSDTFDTITRAHLNNPDAMRYAKFGASAVHRVIYEIDARRHNRILTAGSNLGGHLNLAL